MLRYIFVVDRNVTPSISNLGLTNGTKPNSLHYKKLLTKGWKSFCDAKLHTLNCANV